MSAKPPAALAPKQRVFAPELLLTELRVVQKVLVTGQQTKATGIKVVWVDKVNSMFARAQILGHFTTRLILIHIL